MVAKGMLNTVRHIPFDFKARTGLVNQLHDAVLFQVPIADADYTCNLVTTELTQKIPELPVTFTAEATAGYSWAEV